VWLEVEGMLHQAFETLQTHTASTYPSALAVLARYEDWHYHLVHMGQVIDDGHIDRPHVRGDLMQDIRESRYAAMHCTQILAERLGMRTHTLQAIILSRCRHSEAELNRLENIENGLAHDF
jgi:hypothetical protein